MKISKGRLKTLAEIPAPVPLNLSTCYLELNARLCSVKPVPNCLELWQGFKEDVTD
jgi:hypothetical protein